MPFITENRRDIIDNGGLNALNILKPSSESDIQVGDICYVYYKKIVERWKANPRWTTAHEIYRDTLCARIDDYTIAHKLAWQVFFQLFVMPYELKKREENGDIY